MWDGVGVLGNQLGARGNNVWRRGQRFALVTNMYRIMLSLVQSN